HRNAVGNQRPLDDGVGRVVGGQTILDERRVGASAELAHGDRARRAGAAGRRLGIGSTIYWIRDRAAACRVAGARTARCDQARDRKEEEKPERSFHGDAPRANDRTEQPRNTQFVGGFRLAALGSSPGGRKGRWNSRRTKSP